MFVKIREIFVVGICKVVLLIILLCGRTLTYKTHSALSSVVFTNIDDPEDDVHSEYYFGICATRHRTLQLHRHFTYEQLNGNLIVGEWVNITEDPICIYIRAKSPYGDSVRYHPLKFSICICSIVYNYQGEIFTYRYYEWYIPLEISEGITWDLFFYARQPHEDETTTTVATTTKDAGDYN